MSVEGEPMGPGPQDGEVDQPGARPGAEMEPNLPEDRAPRPDLPGEEASEPLPWDEKATEPSQAHQDQDPITTRRLVQADTLIRMGKARLEEPMLVLSLQTTPEITMTTRFPLPPDPLEPVLEIRIADSVLGHHERETFFHTVKDLFSSLLPGPVTLKMQPDRADIRWSPRPVSMEVEAQARFQALAEHLLGVTEGVLSGGDLDDLVGRLEDTLEQYPRRGELLSQVFSDYALLRSPMVGLIHLLAYRTVSRDPDQPLLLAYLTNADLWSPLTGRGFYLALHLPPTFRKDRRAELASRIVHAVARRFGLILEESTEFELLGDWKEIDRTCLLWAPGSRDLGFSDLLLSLAELLRFCNSFLDLVHQGSDPFDLLGSRPGGTATARPADLGGGALAAGDAGRPRSGPTVEAGQPDWKTALEKLEERVAGLVQNGGPGDQLPEEAAPPPKVSRKPDAVSIDSLSAREVVQKLGAEEPRDMDVFLSHPGYNLKKTMDIMSIALSLSKEECQAICERAPCLIVGPVTRTKAATLKTILEGTGARIRVVATGSEKEETP